MLTSHQDLDFSLSPAESLAELFSQLPKSWRTGQNIAFDGLFGGSAPDTGATINAGVDKAVAEEEKMYQQTRSDLMPGITSYAQTTPYLSGLLGVPGSTYQDPSKALNTSAYQWALNQGLGQINNADAATGNLYSGAHQKGIAGYTTGLASQNVNSYLSNLMQLMNSGQNAASTTGQFGTQTAANIGNQYITGAEANAASQMAQYNTQQQGWGSLGSMLGMAASIGLAPFTGGTSLIGAGMSGLGALFGGGGAGGGGGGGGMGNSMSYLMSPYSSYGSIGLGG